MDYLLTKRMQSALEGSLACPLTILEAPMGFGKTETVKHHLKGVDADIRWVNVIDDSLSAFWKQLYGALPELDDDDMIKVMGMGFPMNPDMVRDIMEVLSNIRFERPVIIAIDDLHLVDGIHVNRLIDAFVKSGKTDLRIIATTRYLSLESLEEHKLKGRIHFIGKSCFEFNEDDIMAYFRLKRTQIDRTEAKRLKEHTEGWISSLYLICMEYKETGEFNDTSGIYDLIDKSIYRPLPEAHRSFLKKMSVFPSFTLAQARWIAKNHDPSSIIEELINRNAFVRYDRANRCYRMHNLLMTHLMDQAEVDQESEVIHDIAGEWYFGVKDYWNAMLHFYKAGNYNRIIDILLIEQAGSIHSERKAKFIEIMESCPQSLLLENPLVLLTYGIKMMAFNEMELFGKTCKLIGMALADKSRFDENELRQLNAEFQVLLSFTRFNDINGMHEHLAIAHKLMTGTIRFMDRHGGWWSFGCPSILTLFHRESGKADETMETFRKAVPTYQELTDYHGAGCIEIMEGEIAYLRGDFDHAEIMSHKAMQLALTYEQPDMYVCASFLLARCLKARGRNEDVVALMAQTRRETIDRKSYHLGNTVDACRILLDAFGPEDHAVPAWLSEPKFRTTAFNFAAHPFMYTVLTRHLLDRGEYSQLIGMTGPLKNVIERVSMYLPLMVLDLHTAIALENKHMRDQAESLLKSVIVSAAPDRFHMIFAEVYPQIKDIIHRMDTSDVPAEFLLAIVSAGKTCFNDHGVVRKTGDTTASLTQRELEIVRLAMEGLTNKAIGERLYISTNTVKSSLKVIFDKQGITSRALLKDPTA